MKPYHSTRSRTISRSAKEAIALGIAPDGGLFVSDALGSEKLDVNALVDADYPAIARAVLALLLPDYTAGEIAACVDEAYRDTFASAEVTPVVKLGSAGGEDAGDGPATFVLELFHGPTSAFKDVALQMLPRLMARAGSAGGSHGGAGADERNMDVTAPTGDTGKAAHAGYADAPGCGITVFFPEGKVSRVQELQMTTQEGANVAVCAVRGNFDDAQSAVKRIFADRELAERLADLGWTLSSANSINVGRLVPQVVYYVAAYAQLVRAGAIEAGDEVEFCVPTGNFGDVLAGYYAKLMGLPARKLIVASNANDVLTDFITTGTYDRRRPFHKTISPSMDILVSSNLERLLFYLSDGDCELVYSLMKDLAEQGFYTVPERVLERLHETFECGRADDTATRETIRETWERHGVILDPHTAVARHVLEARPADGVARVCLSTASPYKFSADVLAALGHDTTDMDGFECMDALFEVTGVKVPEALSALRDAQERFSDVVSVPEMSGYVEDAAARILA